MSIFRACNQELGYQMHLARFYHSIHTILLVECVRV